MTRPPLSVLERLAWAGVLAMLLTFALTRNPVWAGLHDAPGPLPNTPLAFLVLAVVLSLGFLVPRQPMLLPAIATGLVLAFATYPWSLLRWEGFFPIAGLADEFISPPPPGPLDWIAFVAPVAVLVVVPVLLQIRSITTHYEAKGALDHEVAAAGRVLQRQAAVAGAATLLVVAGLGIVARVATHLPVQETLRENPLVVLLMVTILFIAALAVGTGLLRPPGGATRSTRPKRTAQRS